MPLDAHVTGVGNGIAAADALNQPVRSMGPRLEPFSQPIDALVVVRNHGRHGRSRRAQKLSAGLDGMQGIPGIAFDSTAVRIGSEHIRQVRVQRSTIVDVHELQAPAYAQTRQLQRIDGRQQGAFDAVALHVDGAATGGVGGEAVPSGVDVRPAGHEDAVGDAERNPKGRVRKFGGVVPLG